MRKFLAIDLFGVKFMLKNKIPCNVLYVLFVIYVEITLNDTAYEKKEE